MVDLNDGKHCVTVGLKGEGTEIEIVNLEAVLMCGVHGLQEGFDLVE